MTLAEQGKEEDDKAKKKAKDQHATNNVFKEVVT